MKNHFFLRSKIYNTAETIEQQTPVLPPTSHYFLQNQQQQQQL